MVARLVAILHEKVNFDDNLSRQGSPRAVRDPVLGAALAGWAGKLLIACAAPLASIHRSIRGVSGACQRERCPLNWDDGSV